MLYYAIFCCKMKKIFICGGRKMAYNRNIRIEYYKVVVARKYEDSEDKEYNLELLIKKAKQMSIEDRTFAYYQEDARLDKIKYEKSTGYWYLNFMRLRQTKLPLKAKVDEEAEAMYLDADEYIGEDVTALYDCKINIFSLQRNRDSLSATGIESYLTKLYGNDEFGIYLRPILDHNVDTKLMNAKAYRKISLKFATDKTRKKKILPNTSLSRMAKFFEMFDANSAELTMSLGRGGRKGTLDTKEVGKTISEIRESEDFVVGAVLSVRYNEIDPVDTIDLFTMKCFDIIKMKVEPLKTIPFEDIAEQICVKYNRRKRELLEQEGAI